MKTNNSIKYGALALLLAQSLNACEVYYTPRAPVYGTHGASVTFTPGNLTYGVRVRGIAVDGYFQDWIIGTTTFPWTYRCNTLYFDGKMGGAMKAYSLPSLGAGSKLVVTLEGATTTSFYTLIGTTPKYLPSIVAQQTLVFADPFAQGVLSLNPGSFNANITFTVVK